MNNTQLVWIGQARDFLEKIVDTSSERRGGVLGSPSWHCKYCRGSGRLPPNVQHIDGCLIAQIKNFLQQVHQSPVKRDGGFENPHKR